MVFSRDFAGPTCRPMRHTPQQAGGPHPRGRKIPGRGSDFEGGQSPPAPPGACRPRAYGPCRGGPPAPHPRAILVPYIFETLTESKALKKSLQKVRFRAFQVRCRFPPRFTLFILSRPGGVNSRRNSPSMRGILNPNISDPRTALTRTSPRSETSHSEKQPHAAPRPGQKSPKIEILNFSKNADFQRVIRATYK